MNYGLINSINELVIYSKIESLIDELTRTGLTKIELTDTELSDEINKLKMRELKQLKENNK